MRKVGLVVGLLLCASCEGRAEAKGREPATRSQAHADCLARAPRETECYKVGPDCSNQVSDCLNLITYAESAFKAGRWHPSQGPWGNCGDRRTGTAYGRPYRLQCSYLSNIDKDPEFKALVERREEEEKRREEAKKEAARRSKAEKEELVRQQKAHQEERERRQPCAKVWSAYVEPLKQKFDSSLERRLYNLPEAAVPPAWELQRVFDETLTDAVNMLKKPASAEEQLGTYVELLYLTELGTSEKCPDACSEYKFDPSGHGEDTRKAINARLAKLSAQVEARAAEIKRQTKLEEAHERKLFAAIRRAGAKDDAWYRGLGETMVEYGMKEMRGRAVLLDWEDESFALIQVLPGGRALFDGGFPFTAMVVGIKTANLMHSTALTDIGLHWVKVLGFVNYTNPMGGQGQAVKVKPLRNIPHPERGQKLK